MGLYISLPNIVDKDEDLARVIHGGSSRKSIKRLFNIETKKVQPSRFIDTRNPIELSVNRISTLNDKDVHNLGINHTDQINRTRTDNDRNDIYYGYAVLKAGLCFEEKCRVLKDDEGGKKPYHANIVYPNQTKADNMEIANILAFKSELVLYTE